MKDENKSGPEKELVAKFLELRNIAKKKGLTDDQIRNALKEEKDLNCNKFTADKLSVPSSKRPIWKRKKNLKLFFLTVVVPVMFAILIYGYWSYEEILETIRESRCAVDNNGFFIEVARPPTNCEMCRGVYSVPIEHGITTERFVEKYAYTAVPVLIKEATKNWTAMDNFSFEFFRGLYRNVSDGFKVTEEECQFFPYKTEFETLEEAFNMSDDRAQFKQGEKSWYFGWSNCHPDIAKVLRNHYNRPYFLPNDSESSSLDWMFMGGSGLGAFVHLDYVQRPSWQAQISGKKTWTLIPTPECENICHSMNVTVHKGDIIVIDTNQWYHATYIHPGEISITIGSEYD